MASGQRGQSLEKLYIELGLDISQLQADILAADRTVTENLGRLNREKNTIKLRMEADIASLDRVKDATKILEVREKALNDQLAMQTDRMKILEASYRQVASNANSTAKAVQSAEQAFLREKIAVGQLQQQLRDLASQKTPPTPTNDFLSGYQKIKGNISGTVSELTNSFNSLQDATSSVDAAITALLGVIGSIPRPVGVAVTALIGLPIIFKTIENSIVDLIKASASAGDATYVMSRGFQMSIADTGKFTAMCKTAGVEVNDLASTVKRTQQQIIRGGENAKAETWLKRYGESAFDANGHLKDMNEMTLTLSRALKRAQAEGNGMAFILATMRGASADAITAIEDAVGVYEQAAGLIKNGLANPALAHEVQGNINAMNLQASFMHASFESALLPVANEIIPRLTERMGKMTSLIKDNKDVILDLGRDLAQVWGAVENTVDKVIDGVSGLTKLARDNRVVRQTNVEDIIKKYTEDSSVKTAKDLVDKEIANGGYTTEDRAKLLSRADLYQKELQRTQQDLKALFEKRREDFAEQFKPILEKYKADTEIKTMTDLMNRLTAEEKKLIENAPSEFFVTLAEKVGVLNLELQKLQATAEGTDETLEALLKKPLSGANASVIGQERQRFENNDELIADLREARKYIENADEIFYKLNHTDYQNKLFDLQKWLREQLSRDTEQSLEKYQAVMEEYSARLDQIKKEQTDKIAQYWENAAEIEYEMTHTAFEKELRDIEKWKEAQKEKASTAEEIAGIVANAAVREAQAFEREVERIKGKMQTLDDKIFELDHSQYENDLRKLQREILTMAEEFQSSGMLNAEAQSKLGYYYQRAKEKLDERGAKDKGYKKSPIEGGLQRGGNGIVVIGGDNIIDDGLTRSRQAEIGLLTDENKIREQLLPNLSDEGREFVAAQQAVKKFTDTQNIVAQAAEKAASSFQLIEGDMVTSMPELAELPTEPLQQFSAALQQSTTEIQQASPAESIANAERQLTEKLNQATQALPSEYFRNLAEGIENVSTMQLSLTESTMKLIDAQELYRNMLANSTKGSSQDNQDSKGGLKQLSYTTGKEMEPLPTPPRNQSKGWQLGFDQDTAGLVASFAGMAAMIGGAPMTAPVLAGITALSALGGLAKGSYDAMPEPQATGFGNTDLTALTMPLASIDTNVQSVLQAIQSHETTLSFDTLITPLSSIENLVSQIVTALSTREPAQVNVSPTVDIDLGGAYVFDDELKQSLVTDITNSIVDEITSVVESATNRTSYGYGV